MAAPAGRGGRGEGRGGGRGGWRDGPINLTAKEAAAGRLRFRQRKDFPELLDPRRQGQARVPVAAAEAPPERFGADVEHKP